MEPERLEQLLTEINKMLAEETMKNEIKASLQELRADIEKAMQSLDHFRRYCRSIGHFKM